MENNNENQMPQEEIPNLEQFQVGRAPSEQEEQSQSDDEILPEDSDMFEDDELDEGDETDETDDSEYTEDEVEFADGDGTLLDDEIGDEDDEDLEDMDKS